MLILRTLAEIAVVITLVFGFLRENKFVKLERKAVRFLKSLRKRMRLKREQELKKELLQAQYAQEYETERSSKTKPAETGKKRRSSRGKVA